jgi:hypothetical protein
MMLGDSVINGGNLTDQSELATTILENKLQQGMHKLVTVGNISAGSWGPCNLLAYIEKYGLFDADVIIVVFNSEDCADIPTFQPLNPHTHPQTRPLLGLTEAIVHYLPRYFPSLLGDSSMKHVPLISEASIRRSLGCIRDLINAAKSNSISMVVMQYLDREEVLSSPKSGYYAILETVEETGAAVYSRRADFKKSIDSGENPFRDYLHPNEIGQNIIANILFNLLKNNMLSSVHS